MVGPGNPAAADTLPHLIIGGGAAGIWLAACLVARGAKRIDIVEPNADIGRGIAYRKGDPAHLLNVTPERMDANPLAGFPNFGDWISEHGLTAEGDYYPRAVFGDYMDAVVAEIEKRAQIVRHPAEAVSLTRHDQGFRVTLSDGRTLAAKDVVVAVGNLAPKPIAPGIRDSRIIEDPWNIPGESVKNAKRIVIAGAGLTAVDVVVSLIGMSSQAHISLSALHSFMPPEDLATGSWPGAAAAPSAAPSAVWRWVIDAIRKDPRPENWISIIEGMKGQTNRIWSKWSPSERATFTRHGLRHWLHHRHRTPPPSYRLMKRVLGSGQVDILHGHATDIRPTPEGVVVRVGAQDVLADLVINATGPSVAPASSRFLKSAVDAGLLTVDTVNLGLAVDPDGRSLDAAGDVAPGLWVLGAWTRGSHFEVVPVPVIRKRAGAIASALQPA